MRSRPFVSLIVSTLVLGVSSVLTDALALETFRALPVASQRPAPAFTLPDHRGSHLSLEDLRGQVVVVRFWATW